MDDDAGAARAGRRERKKTATRAAIRDAAMRLVLRDGLGNVTLEQITAEADIALRTFFNYFSSKEEAVVAAAAAGDFRAWLDAFRARPPGESVLQALREASLLVLDRAMADRSDSVAVLLALRRERSLTPHLLAALAAQETALAGAVAERLGDSPDASSTYPQLCAATTLAAMRVVLDRWLDGAEPGAVPSSDGIRAELDQALRQLAEGLDRPGVPQ